MFNKKFVIIVSIIFTIIIITCGGAKVLSTKSEVVGNVNIFNTFDSKFESNCDKTEETLSLKNLEDDEKTNISTNNVNLETIIINNPVVELKENKTEIAGEEVKEKLEMSTKNDTIQNSNKNLIETNVTNQSKEVFVKFVKNEKVIANMESLMFALVPTEWFFSSSKVVIDSNGIDENTEYVTFNELNQNILRNKKSGDIKIFAYDEIWNNGKNDYVLKTRCYVR